MQLSEGTVRKVQFNYCKIQAGERPENRKEKSTAALYFTFVVISVAISLLIVLKR